ncbi:MAG: hypothetical protein EOO70_08395 [Myxococcaceae bacterium]|nr:MAG: hypothetical protein EOO70_08395 [Myxococcaceae bacterium]
MQKTSEQIDTVRSNILLRQTLARWRAIHHHNLTLPNTADAHRTHHLKAAALSKWIVRLKAVDLAKRGDTFEERVKRERVEQTWSPHGQREPAARAWFQTDLAPESRSTNVSCSRVGAGSVNVGVSCTRSRPPSVGTRHPSIVSLVFSNTLRGAIAAGHVVSGRQTPSSQRWPSGHAKALVQVATGGVAGGLLGGSVGGGSFSWVELVRPPHATAIKARSPVAPSAIARRGRGGGSILRRG